MLSTTDYKALTGLTIEGSTEAQIIAHMRKKIGVETDAAIATALLAHYLLDVRAYKVNEAAAELDTTSGTVSKYAARGHVLHLAATPTTARTVWAQVCSMSLPDARAMAETLTAKGDDDRAAHLARSLTRAAVGKRLGDNATPEKADAIAERIEGAGIVLPNKITAAIPSIATELEIALPEPKRSGSTDGANDRKSEQVPTPQAALSILERFERDREQGSDDQPFQVTDEEAGALQAAAAVAVRILRQAGRVAEIIEAQAFTADSLDKMTEPASA